MRRVRSVVVVAVALACASVTAASASRAETVETSPFKARLVQNIAIATRARATLGAQARRKAPKGMTAEQRKGYEDQTRWLADTSGRFASLEARMQTALAKPKGSSSEVAQLNAEFGALRDAAASESQRYEPLAPACRERHAATVTALRG